MSATIVFSHANGFPAGTYRLLFEHWRAAGWRVEALARFGHDPRHPVSSNWPHLRNELIEFVEALRPDGPVHLVGHSLGGFLSLLAACRRPELARSVVLIDSPLLTGWRAHSVHVVKLSGLMARVSPGRIARKRRQHWPSAEAALAHFGAKAVFARWQPEVLADYVACGTEPAAQGGVQLGFRREIEARIYDTLPHHLSTLLRRHPPRCPVAFVGGTRSAELRQVGLGATRRLVQERLRWIEGGHLFPMEQPQQTAQAVLDLLPGC